MRHEARFSCMKISNSKSGGNMYFEFKGNKLEYFLKLILSILYMVSKLGKLGVQRFKRCINRSWNEEFMAIGRQPHQAKRQFRKLRNHKIQLAKSTFSCEMDTFSLRNFCNSCSNLKNPFVCSQIFAIDSFRFLLQIFFV